MNHVTVKLWYHVPIEEAAKALEVDLDQGLSSSDHRRRLDAFGPNRMKAKKGRGPVVRFLLQFHQPLVYILLAGTIVTAGLQEWVDAGVIFGVVLVNAIIGFVQESKAEKAIESLKRMVMTETTALRDGTPVKVPSEDLVAGDVVLLSSGDKIPADLRLFKVRDLQIDESILTGESVPVEKQADLLPEATVLADRTNTAYAGTLVTYGQARGIVVGTGDNTETGKISDLVSSAHVLETPLTRKIARFSRFLLVVILILAGATFGIGVLRGESKKDMFISAVALAVGAIPEGLPAAVTITLAIGVSRMARRRAIIRKLPAVETLGSTTVICSDKTGTLTENQMTVQQLWLDGRFFTITGVGYDPDGTVEGYDPSLRGVQECLRAGLLCNDSQVVYRQDRWAVQGDPTEGALIVAARKAGMTEKDAREKYPRVDSLPFESQHQYMATLHGAGSEPGRVIYLKGAVEKVLDRCAHGMNAHGEIQDLIPDDVLKAAGHLAQKGLRVLAFARCTVGTDKNGIHHEDLGKDFVLLGLQGMIDPPRKEAGEAVASCRTAGIRVKMITGDHALTASAIAAQLGLAGNGVWPETVTGKELADVPEARLPDLVANTAVFARVAPEQKLRLVEALQSQGHVVAMTGDGVNDAPALKAADIGVAMGITGTEVAKEAGDMLLTDDNFATIVDAVKEGRAVFDNLTKFITWTLPTNMGEGLVILAAVVAGAVLPILPLQILWINMTTAILLGLMLAFEPPEPGIMTRPPQDPKRSILTGELIKQIFLVSFVLLVAAFGLFIWYLHRGYSLDEARTVAVTVFVLIETFYLFACRSLTRSIWEIGFFSNPWVLGGSAGMILLQVAFVHLPIMNRLFHSAPLSWLGWAEAVVAGAVAYFLVSLEKLARQRLGQRNRRS